MIPIKKTNLDDLCNQHFKAVSEQLHIEGKLDTVTSWFKDYGLGLSLKKVITAPVPLLKQIAKRYSNAPSNLILKDMYENRFSKSSKWIGLDRYNAVILVQNLGIKVCPYCNRNYINNVPVGKSTKRTSQLDHFFNKADYPYLAMSFYNLVPVCPACNLLKLKNDISASPYDTNIDWDKAVQFDFGITSADFLKHEKDVYVKICVSDELKENFNVLKLREQYSIHNDLLHEMLIKGIMYSPKRLNEIMKNYSGLFHSREELMGIIYGNYLEVENLEKRPLSKLTRDIVNRLYNK
ncbi:hypothetical protein [Bacillus inaquosorum]|uniref:hypothetical protein n=1 Tax=Bacillus inaquosorum TaxID=483913 RepID=UPI00227DE51A|nr:hypothetical protein [Bacillus inaquosorum]MCY9178439.1 hypothetical protein [Bacillus inaquosorum]